MLNSTKQLPPDSKVTLKGAFDNVDVVGSKIYLDIPEGSVQKLTAEEASKGMVLNLSKDAKIVSLILNAVSTIVGAGTIDTATLSTIAKGGSTFETAPTKIIDAGTIVASPTPTPVITAPPTTESTPGPIATATPAPTIPQAPTNLNAIAGNLQAHLTWSSVTGATYYNVYQSLDDTTYQLVNTSTSVTTATYDVTGLTNGTPYYFKTTAANSAGESNFSNTISSTPTNAPVNLGIAGKYVILAKAGVTNTGTSAITGDIGVSPIAATGITGFNLIADASNQFSTSSQVTGSVYAANYSVQHQVRLLQR